ncbi:sulfotransferase family 2 domain-containing protein [Seohaeicola sp.]|uniref:sulfotransferase family 2 domain-containing protein n=1 Tax=Seohaeicola sp. TaxID=2042026 RepID=UPI003A89A426
MIISRSHNFVFIHIAKNGGTSVESVLKQYGIKGLNRTHLNEAISMLPYQRAPENMVHPPHMNACWIRDRIGHDIFDNMFTFAIVRNPFDQMVSRYEYVRQNKRHHSHRAAARLNFSDFLTIQRWRNWNFTKTQHSKVADKQGNIVVKKIYRFECFSEILPDVTSILGLPQPDIMPHSNASERKPYQEYYDKSSRHFVEKHFRKDLEFFEYSFD